MYVCIAHCMYIQAAMLMGRGFTCWYGDEYMATWLPMPSYALEQEVYYVKWTTNIEGNSDIIIVQSHGWRSSKKDATCV